MKIFKKYYLRTILVDLKIVISVLLGCLISTTLISATVFIVDNIECYINEYSYLINHGDLLVSQKKMPNEEENYDKKNNILEKYLKENTNTQYVVEQYMRPYADALLEAETGKTIVGDSYWYRIIDYKDFDRYMDVSEIPPKNNVVLSKSLANRLNAKKGDKIRISFNLNSPKLHMIISEVIPDNEINIPNSNIGYIFIDASFYKEYNNINSFEFRNIGLKNFYIDGEESNLKKVEEKAYEVYGNKYTEITYALDMRNSAYANYHLTIGFLTFFSSICFVLSSIGLINLMYVIVIERQKDIAILKVYGLSNGIEKIYILLETLILVVPTYLLGIIGGYILFHRFLINIPSLGIACLSGYDLFFSILKIFGINFFAVLLLCIPIVVFSIKRNIVDILRGNSITFKHKNQILLTVVCIILGVFVVLKVIINSTDIILMLLIMLAIVAILMLFSFLLTKILHLLKGKSIYRISISSLIRNEMRVPITTVTYAFCFTMIFVMLLINYSLSSMVSNTVMKDFDYNVEVRVNEKTKDIIQNYISQNQINNFYKINGYNAKIDNLDFILDVYDFSNYQGSIEKKIKEGLNLGIEFDYLYNFDQTSLINISMQENNTAFIIGGKNYKSPIIEDRYLEAGIEESYITNSNAALGEIVEVSYLFKLNKTQTEAFIEFVKENDGMRLITINDIVNNKLAEMQGYKYLINNMTIYFLFGTFVIVLTSSIITFLERKKEFALYSILGADRNMLKKNILFENAMLAIFGGVIGFFLSISLLKIISKILFFSLQMNYMLALALFGTFIIISIVVTEIIIKVVPFDTVHEIIREE